MIILPYIRKYFKANSIYHFLVFIELLYIIPFYILYEKSGIKFFINKDIKDINLVETIKVIGRTTIESIEFREQINFISIIMLFILLGVAYFIIVDIYHHKSVMRMLMRWNRENVEDNIQKIFNEIIIEMNINIPIKIMENDLLKSPIVTGILNKKIFLPSETKDLDDKVIKNYIYHELIHIKQNDNLIALIIRFIEIVMWYNPVNHLICKKIKLYCEMACDEKVLLNKDNVFKNEYIKTIVMTMNWKNKYKTFLINNFSVSKRSVCLRVQSMLNTKNKKNFLLFFPITILVFIIFSFTLYSKLTLYDSEIYYKCKNIIYMQDIESDNYYNDVVLEIFKEISNNIYSKYEIYGIKYDVEAQRLYYNNYLIRNFEDSRKCSKTVLYYLEGDVDIYILRDNNGKITGIKETYL